MRVFTSARFRSFGTRFKVHMIQASEPRNKRFDLSALLSLSLLVRLLFFRFFFIFVLSSSCFLSSFCLLLVFLFSFFSCSLACLFVFRFYSSCLFYRFSSFFSFISLHLHLRPLSLFIHVSLLPPLPPFPLIIHASLLPPLPPFPLFINVSLSIHREASGITEEQRRRRLGRGGRRTPDAPPHPPEGRRPLGSLRRGRGTAAAPAAGPRAPPAAGATGEGEYWKSVCSGRRGGRGGGKG